MEHIYILRLKAGKYYIGKTKNVDKRWAEHTAGCGSGWTKKYPPLSLVKSVVSTSHFDEDRYVKEYMEKYGIENVRGGTYSNVVLDANCIAVLEKEIRHSKNLCVRCGRGTHFVKDCYATTDSDGMVIKETAKDTVKNAKQDAKQDVKATKNNETSYYSTQSIKIANNKGIIPKTTIFKVSNNVSNENIEFYNIRDYGRWCETDIAKNGSWKINVS
jgi:hypothetical protein